MECHLANFPRLRHRQPLHGLQQLHRLGRTAEPLIQRSGEAGTTPGPGGHQMLRDDHSSKRIQGSGVVHRMSCPTHLAVAGRALPFAVCHERQHRAQPKAREGITGKDEAMMIIILVLSVFINVRGQATQALLEERHKAVSVQCYRALLEPSPQNRGLRSS